VLALLLVVAPLVLWVLLEGGVLVEEEEEDVPAPVVDVVAHEP
jgi:hypothetical protein